MVPISYNLRSLTVRRWSTLAIASGIGIVVFLFASVRMFANGLQRAMGSAGSPDVAVVLRQGADDEMGSAIPDAQVGVVAALDGVRRNAEGKPEVRADVVSVVRMDKVGGGVSNVRLRGLPDDGLGFREVRITEGRAPRPGADEAMIGKSIAGRFAGLGMGQSFDLPRGRKVEVVGIFETDSSLLESEVWTGVDTLRAAFGLTNLVSAVRVRLESPGAIERLEAAVDADPQLELDVVPEPEYYRRHSRGITGLITLIAMIVVVFFSIAAILGASITMYTAIARRSREIGTLRALGFGRGAILLTFVLECMLLALAGGIVGIAASFAVQSLDISFYNPASNSELVLSFNATPGTLVGSLVLAAVIGIVGGLMPAVRASRMNAIEAMRS